MFVYMALKLNDFYAGKFNTRAILERVGPCWMLSANPTLNTQYYDTFFSKQRIRC
jgi:hypothetical protein